MSDRAASLAEHAAEYLGFEAISGKGEAGRRATRDMLCDDARRLGFLPAEISTRDRNGDRCRQQQGEGRRFLTSE